MPKCRIILTHGAGAGMQSAFLAYLTQCLSSLDILVEPFEFNYMQQMNETGKRRPPPRVNSLEEELLLRCQQSDDELPTFLAGKSMGGRVASMVLERSNAIGAVCFGYPFHPVKRKDSLRTAHLLEITKPVLVVQGTRDPFGRVEEVEHYPLSPNVQVTWLANGDHDYKGSGYTFEQRIESAADTAVSFIYGCL